MPKPLLKISGIAPDGKYVVSGAFQFLGACGVPIYDALVLFQKNNCYIDIKDYVLCAARHNLSQEMITNNILQIAPLIGKSEIDAIISVGLILAIDSAVKELGLSNANW